MVCQDPLDHRKLSLDDYQIDSLFSGPTGKQGTKGKPGAPGKVITVKGLRGASGPPGMVLP